jgi:hypothetical protein
VCSTKGRVSKRTIPAHEALSGSLQAEETRKIAQVLSHRPELVDIALQILLAGDSICVATLFNPKIVMKNVLLKTAIMAVKDKCQEIIRLFPNATIQLAWMDGKLNAADSTSKLMFENIEIMNSKLYRNGPGNLHYESEERVVFYRITKDKEEWIPLPEKLIMRAKADTEKIQSSESSETFANNKPEEIEECQLCHQTEDCGIYLTRQMAKDQQATGKEVEILPGLQSRKRKLKSDSCEGSGLV